MRTDLDRERKSRIGLRGLTQTLNTQENQNVTDKLYHVRNFLVLVFIPKYFAIKMKV